MLSQANPSRRTPIAYWILGALLAIYVAACTGQRDNKWGADAWEHHRVVLALTHHLWHPGNPTYAVDLPSVRYSPYMIAWAVVCRTARIDPYNALSAAAVVNTVLLVIGLWMLLKAFDESPAAAAVLVVMLLLYGSAPGYANSYALSDLPWHQVNPSAWSFGLTLIAWSLYRRLSLGGRNQFLYLPVLVLATLAMLDHPMTGAFGIMGLFIIALTAPGVSRRRILLMAMLIAAAVALLCLAWPWYSFLAALRNHQDNDYWFNPGILYLSLTRWCAPALLCVLFTIPLRSRPLIRVCLIGGALSFAAGIGSLLIHSPVFARFPLPGMIYLHIAIGIFVHETGLLRLSTWPARLRALAAPSSEAAPAMVQLTVAAMLIYCAAPQALDILTEPHLGRIYVTRLLHHRDLQQHPRQTLTKLLAPVGENDVVLSDPETSWLIPSVRGRVVAGIHYELFVPGQSKRREDVDRFFSERSEPFMDEIINRYHVQWIVLNRQQIGQRAYDSLLRPAAVVARDNNMALMNAPAWLAAGNAMSSDSK